MDIALIVITMTMSTFAVIAAWYDRKRRKTKNLTNQTLPGESFCSDCPDHEACATGYSCDMVRELNGMERTRQI